MPTTDYAEEKRSADSMQSADSIPLLDCGREVDDELYDYSVVSIEESKENSTAFLQFAIVD